MDEDQASVNRSGAADQPAEAIDVRVTTIDDLVDKRAVPPPDIVKMDIEGAEVEALRGAERTLSQRQPVLLIESHNRWNELEPVLKAHRYRYRVVEENGELSSPEPIHILAMP